jgi:hypothetical protein
MVKQTKASNLAKRGTVQVMQYIQLVCGNIAHATVVQRHGLHWSTNRDTRLCLSTVSAWFGRPNQDDSSFEAFSFF